jgi:ACS family hexuronate transporter-like MFS transporter
MTENSKSGDIACVDAPAEAAISASLGARVWTGEERTLVGLLFLSTLINFLDRQTLSIVIPTLRDQFSLSNIDYSRIVFAFLLGYTLSQTLAGRLIDRIGTRTGMIVCVTIWSAAAMLQGLANGFLSFCFARLLLGLAEAGNWPGAVKAMSERFEPERRGFAIGLFHSGAFFGAIIAPPLVVALVHSWGWRYMFVGIGALGFLWVWKWASFQGNKPYRQSPSLPRIEPGANSIWKYLRLRSIWGLIVGRSLADPVWWFYVFWLPEYLVRNRGFALSTIGSTLWIPFVFAALGSGLGGSASGTLVRRGVRPVLARKIVMVTGATLMLLGIPAFLVKSGAVAIALICVVLFGYSSWAANFLSLPADLFPAGDVATITGLLGTAGALGGMLFGLATG